MAEDDMEAEVEITSLSPAQMVEAFTGHQAVVILLDIERVGESEISAGTNVSHGDLSLAALEAAVLAAAEAVLSIQDGRGCGCSVCGERKARLTSAVAAMSAGEPVPPTDRRH